MVCSCRAYSDRLCLLFATKVTTKSETYGIFYPYNLWIQSNGKCYYSKEILLVSFGSVLVEYYRSAEHRKRHKIT